MPSADELRELGFSARDAATLWAHFDDAERRGKLGHGYSRIPWLRTLPDLDPASRPERVEAEPGFERWHGRGALGYLTLAAICGRGWSSPSAASRPGCSAITRGGSPPAASSRR